MKKPSYVSHYLVLSDLIKGIDVREKVDFICYLTSRIENIKADLVKEGIEFQDDISAKNAQIWTEITETLEQCFHFYLNTNYSNYLNTFLNKV